MNVNREKQHILTSRDEGPIQKLGRRRKRLFSFFIRLRFFFKAHPDFLQHWELSIILDFHPMHDMRRFIVQLCHARAPPPLRVVYHRNVEIIDVHVGQSGGQDTEKVGPERRVRIDIEVELKFSNE